MSWYRPAQLRIVKESCSSSFSWGCMTTLSREAHLSITFMAIMFRLLSIRESFANLSSDKARPFLF